MAIKVKAAHINITGSLRDYAEKKAEKVLNFFDGLIDIVIELDIVDSSNDNERQVVSATAKAPHALFRAEFASHDMYASVDHVMDKLIVQVKKYREKQRDHHPDQPKSIAKPKRDNLKKLPHSQDVDPHYDSTPMSIDQAIQLLANRQLPFLMFKNIKSGECNLVYGLKNGNIGHIEP